MIPQRLKARLGKPDRLLRRFCRTGDPAALGALFDHAAPELLRVAAWLSGSRTDAEDLLQRTFVTVIERRENYDSKRAALPWLCGILGNHARKLKDKRAREVRHHRHLVTEASDGSVTLTDPYDTAAEREVVAVVDRLRQELDSPYREVLDLHLGRGLGPAEIAARLDRPPGTVRTQLVRGLQRLRDRMPLSMFSPVAAVAMLSGTEAAAQLTTIRDAVMRVAEAARPPGPVPASGPFGLSGALPTVAAIATVAVIGGGIAAYLGFGRSTTEPAPTGPAVDVAATAPRSAATTPGAHLDRAAAGRAPTVNPLAANAGAAAATGRDITVRVVDDAGAPVPAAELWLSEPHIATRGASIGPSDAAGCRKLTFDAARFVGARHPNHVRSYLALVDPATAGDTVTIALRGGSAPFRGRVFDAAGAALPGATIALGPPGGWRLTNSPHQRTVYPPRAAATTDATGRFAAFGLEPGPSDLEIRAPGHAPLALRVQVPEPARTLPEMTFRLQRGATIAGRVRHLDGSAAGGASITAIDSDGRQTHTTADASGDFAVDGLAAGQHEVRAAATTAAATEAMAHADLETRLGGTTRWHATLHPTREIHGRVVGPDGAPVAGVQVLAGEPTMEAGIAGATTAVDGRFAVTTTARRARTGTLYLRRDGAPIAVRRDVIPAPGSAAAGSELVIELSADEAPTSTLRGRFVDPSGRPIAASISVTNHAFTVGWYAFTNPGTGTFRLGPLRPGSYTLIFEAKGYGRVPVRALAAAPGESRDLGDIVAQPAGSVELTLAGASSGERRLVKFARRDGVVSHVFTDGRPVRAELAPGDYVANIALGDGAGSSVAFTVTAGTTTAVTLPCTTNHLLSVRCSFARAAGPAGRRLDIRITDAAGNLVDAHELACTTAATAELKVHLPPGEYRLDCRCTAGLAATANVSIRSGGQAPMRRLQLR